MSVEYRKCFSLCGGVGLAVALGDHLERCRATRRRPPGRGGTDPPCGRRSRFLARVLAIPVVLRATREQIVSNRTV
eukprot:4069613-Pyramimonas_sp.AAC.1